MREAKWSEFWSLCGTPRRVCWAVAQDGDRRSICPLGWKMQTSHNPPMVAVSIAPSRYTHDLIGATGEFVLVWPGEGLAEETIICGTTSGRDTDKFAQCGLTALPAKEVSVPLIGECIANLECRVTGTLETGDHTIFAGEVVAVHLSNSDSRVQCVVDDSSGYDILFRHPGWTIGAVKR